MYQYLFVDQNNGHFKTYHPFRCKEILTQEIATKVMEKDTLSGRLGVTFQSFLNILDDGGHTVDFWTCECCKNKIMQLENPELDDWVLIEGISGNY